jgi:glucose/mannose transport system substrate-binding protein
MAPIQRSLKFPSLLAALALALAACGAQAPTTGGAATSAPAATAIAAPTTGERKLEIFTYWNGPGEVEGLNALLELYKRQNPDVEVSRDLLTSITGANVRTTFQNRLQRGQPPDSWQVHAGKETLTYVTPGQLEPITQFFRDQGLDKVMPRLLLDQITIKGEIYTVPVNIHRSNVLWYNSKILTENHLQPPKTVQDFFSVAEALKAKGITPLAVGGKEGFEMAHLFESVLLATFGPDDYVRIFQGDGAPWAGPRSMAAVETLKKMLDYANADRAGLSWSDAAQLVLDGKAAMMIMGDWTEGYYKSKGARPNVDFGWSAAPGTDGVFMWISDSFGLARGAPHRDAAQAWLKLCGSKEGQDAFNPRKGSIPARTDADKSLYDEYLQWSIDQFRTDKLAPSIVHGAAAPDSYKTAYLKALDTFSNNLDVQVLEQALDDAATQLVQ